MRIIFVISGLVSFSTSICHYGTTFHPRDVDAVPVADFGYTELEGPLNWHGLKKDNIDCAVGKNQSPINVDTIELDSISGGDLNLVIQSYPNGTELENLGSTLEVIANGTIVFNDKQYNLQQFHFHTPSEHRLDSEGYPMEVHFVFQTENQALSVIGFPIEVSSGNGVPPIWNDIFDHIDDISEPGTVTETGPLDFSDIQGHLANSAVYHYSGSLTTPPCTEGVAWLVVKDPIYIDNDTFQKVKGVIKFNSRYTQNKPGQINLLDNARNILDNS